MKPIRVLFLASIAIFGIATTASAKQRHLPKIQKQAVIDQVPNNNYDTVVDQNSNHTRQHIVLNTANTNQTPDRAAVFSNTSKTVKNTIETASNYIGTGARQGREKLIKLFGDAFDRTVDPTRISWCAAFANGVLGANNLPVTKSLMASSFVSWGKNTHDPKPGDIVLLKLRGNHISHVSFYVATIDSPNGKCVEALGGNQSNKVKYSCYPVSKVAEYRTLG